MRRFLMSITYIVGDKLDEFAKNKNVMTEAEWLEYVQMPRIGQEHTQKYQVGQGVSSQLLELASFQALAMAKKEDKQYVHKKKDRNVMISKPFPASINEFRSELMIDDACAVMEDHVTGQHLQGTVLIEAARQMMLSVTENYMLTDEQRFKLYFVMNEIHTEFKDFAFPLSVEIVCQVSNKTIRASGVKANYVIDFIQAGKVVTSINIKFSTYNKSTLERKEAELAVKVVETEQRSFQDSDTVVFERKIAEYNKSRLERKDAELAVEVVETEQRSFQHGDTVVFARKIAGYNKSRLERKEAELAVKVVEMEQRSFQHCETVVFERKIAAI